MLTISRVHRWASASSARSRRGCEPRLCSSSSVHEGLSHGPAGAALSFCALGGDFSIESGPRQTAAELPGAWGPGGCGNPSGRKYTCQLSILQVPAPLAQRSRLRNQPSVLNTVSRRGKQVGCSPADERRSRRGPSQLEQERQLLFPYLEEPWWPELGSTSALTAAWGRPAGTHRDDEPAPSSSEGLCLCLHRLLPCRRSHRECPECAARAVLTVVGNRICRAKEDKETMTQAILAQGIAPLGEKSALHPLWCTPSPADLPTGPDHFASCSLSAPALWRAGSTS